jgi:hypothetical protein
MDLEKYFFEIKLCPLCNSKKKINYNKFYKNKYSEVISNDLNIVEEKLLNIIQNYKCQECQLIYKKYWFKNRYLKYFYSKVDPVHSKGWDVNSKFFSKKSFLDLIKKLDKQSLNSIDKNKFVRSIISILKSSEINKKNDAKVKKFIFNLKNLNKKYIRNHKKNIVKLIIKPKIFSRFRGFGDQKLFEFIKSKVGPIKNVTEIGCPRWGFINNKKIKIRKRNFLKNKVCAFWGKSCSVNGRNCITTLNHNVKKINKIDSNNDFIGIYLYLDHTTKPLDLIKKVFKKSKSCGVILESGKDFLRKGAAIQHFSLWSEYSIKYLAKLCQKKVDSSFKELQNVGNKFYLIY